MRKVSKRKLRLDRLWKNNELIGKTTDKPCRSCGCTRYLIFLTSDKKSQGVYCADCGLWQKFESTKKKSKRTKKDKKEYIEYLKSDKWKGIRKQVAERDNFTCQRCGKDVKTYFEIHHKNYKHIFHEEEDLSCLVCLCKDCHETITRKQMKGRKKRAV